MRHLTHTNPHLAASHAALPYLAGRIPPFRRLLPLAAVCCLFVVLLWATVAETPPRPWSPDEVPVAFWAWRASAPTAAEVERVRAETKMRVLFMRAGQIEYRHGKSTRIRSVEGAYPTGIELHLVYNATENLLNSFARLDPDQLALVIHATYLNDAERGRDAGAHVRGLQLDFDIPTRLLPRYAELLARLRLRLPQSTQLSITGLPTWMHSAELPAVLRHTDFWIPQFYGSRIPRSPDDHTPIANPSTLPRDITRARRLAHPFYAGLAAYGYALLYDQHGKLILLRGDINPARVARHPALRLIERRPVNAHDAANRDAASSSNVVTAWRTVFLADADLKVDSITMRAGERLIIETPTADGIRLMARHARRTGGAHLRGICLFRLPTDDDPTTLHARALARALADRPAQTNANIHLTAADTTGRFILHARNTGETHAPIHADAFTLTLRFPHGTLRGVADFAGFTTVETLCGDAHTDDSAARPCSPRRADRLRLRAPTWSPGEQARATLILDGTPPPTFTAEWSLHTETDAPHTTRRAVLTATQPPTDGTRR